MHEKCENKNFIINERKEFVSSPSFFGILLPCSELERITSFRFGNIALYSTLFHFLYQHQSAVNNDTFFFKFPSRQFSKAIPDEFSFTQSKINGDFFTAEVRSVSKKS